MKFYQEQNTPKMNSNQSRAGLKWIESLKTKKNLTETNNNNLYNELNYSKDKLNIELMIENAKIHREANRPLYKIKEFDGFTKFCKCCYLPAKDDIYLKNFRNPFNVYKIYTIGKCSIYFFFFKCIYFRAYI